MLIRRKSATDDEYHHEDSLGVFGVITGATGAVLDSNVYDAFMAQQYVPVPSKHPAKCFIAMSEPNMLTGSGGRGVVVPSRGFQVMGKKPAPAKKHACKINKHGPYAHSDCVSMYATCMATANSVDSNCLQTVMINGGLLTLVCAAVCGAAFGTAGILGPVCAACLIALGGTTGPATQECKKQFQQDSDRCESLQKSCMATGYWGF